MQVDIIRWLDTGLAGSDGWKDKAFYMREGKCSEVISAGLLVHEDEEVVIVANSYDPDNDLYVNAQVIAKSAIISRGTPCFDGDIRLLTGLPAERVAA